MREHRVADDRVELRRRDAAVEILGDACDDRHQAAQAALRLRREKRDRRELRKRHDARGSTFGELALAEFALLFAHEIPLVADDDQAFALFDRDAGEAPVLRRDADHRVEDEQRDVAARDRRERTQRRVVFDRAVRLGLLAHAGGVDEANACGRAT